LGSVFFFFLAGIADQHTRKISPVLAT
jgi:hypothetical protein